MVEIKVLLNGKDVSLTVREGSTIADAKRALEKTDGLPPCRQQWFDTTRPKPGVANLEEAEPQEARDIQDATVLKHGEYFVVLDDPQPRWRRYDKTTVTVSDDGLCAKRNATLLVQRRLDNMAAPRHDTVDHAINEEISVVHTNEVLNAQNGPHHFTVRMKSRGKPEWVWPYHEGTPQWQSDMHYPLVTAHGDIDYPLMNNIIGSNFGAALGFDFADGPEFRLPHTDDTQAEDKQQDGTLAYIGCLCEGTAQRKHYNHEHVPSLRTRKYGASCNLSLHDRQNIDTHVEPPQVDELGGIRAENFRDYLDSERPEQNRMLTQNHVDDDQGTLYEDPVFLKAYTSVGGHFIDGVVGDGTQIKVFTQSTHGAEAGFGMYRRLNGTRRTDGIDFPDDYACPWLTQIFPRCVHADYAQAWQKCLATPLPADGGAGSPGVPIRPLRGLYGDDSAELCCVVLPDGRMKFFEDGVEKGPGFDGVTGDFVFAVWLQFPGQSVEICEGAELPPAAAAYVTAYEESQRKRKRDAAAGAGARME